MKKLKEQDTSIHQVCADSVGLIVHHCLKNLDPADKETNTQEVLKIIYVHLGNADKKIQGGAGSCLTRAIQNSSPEVLCTMLPQISEKIYTYLSNPHFKCKTQILESLISLIIAVEIRFEEFAVPYIPSLIEQLSN